MADCPATSVQEGGWTDYPTFTELHQILYRSESNLYENFVLPPGITAGDDGSHVNDKTMAMFRKVLGRPAKFIVEVRRLFRTHLHHPLSHPEMPVALLEDGGQFAVSTTTVQLATYQDSRETSANECRVSAGLSRTTSSKIGVVLP